MPEGAYGAVVAWRSKDAWIESIRRFLGSIEGDRWRRDHRYSASADMMLAVARVDASCADHGTGRSLTTSNRFVAMVLGCSEKTVQRCRVMLTDAGFYSTVAEGRYLTTAEREAAYAAHGCRQLRAASVRALTVPRPPVRNVHLPRSGDVLDRSPVRRTPPTRAHARAVAAPRPATTRRVKVARGSSRLEGPRPLSDQVFAAQLVLRMPFLARRRHIGAVSAMLHRAGVDPARWTVDTLLAAVEAYRLEAGIRVRDLADQRDPLAYFAWLVRNAVDPAAETPLERRERVRRAELEAQAAERAAEAARIASIDHEEVDRILAQMRRDFPRRPHRQGWRPPADAGE